MSLRIFPKRHSPWKHLAGGLIGGLAATAAMSQFQNALHKVTKSGQEKSTSPEREFEDATVKAAAKVSRLAGHELSPEEKKKAGPLVHYGFGTTMGGLYGMAKANVPRRLRHTPRAITGAAFGTSLFLAAHEVTVPVLGLAPKPSESPLAEHASELAGHLIYGLTLEAVHAITLKLL
jgi:putative membrane protein